MNDTSVTSLGTGAERIVARLKICAHYNLYPPEFEDCVQEYNSEWTAFKVHSWLINSAENMNKAVDFLKKQIGKLGL